MESILVKCEDIPSCQNSTEICKGNIKIGLKTSWVESMRKWLQKWYIVVITRSTCKCWQMQSVHGAQKACALRGQKICPKMTLWCHPKEPSRCKGLWQVSFLEPCVTAQVILARLFGHVHFGAFEYERKLISDTVILLNSVLPSCKIFCCIL